MPLIPGYNDDEQSVEVLVREAVRVGALRREGAVLLSRSRPGMTFVYWGIINATQRLMSGHGRLELSLRKAHVTYPYLSVHLPFLLNRFPRPPKSFSGWRRKGHARRAGRGQVYICPFIVFYVEYIPL